MFEYILSDTSDKVLRHIKVVNELTFLSTEIIVSTMKKTNPLEDKIKDSLFISDLTGIDDDYQIDHYRLKKRTKYRLDDIENKGYSEYSRYEKW